MQIKSVALVAGLALGLMSGTARAELLHFDYSGTPHFSFDMESMPTPIAYYVGLYTTIQNPSSGVYTYFYNNGIGGGLNYNGPGDVGLQIYSGSEADPVFSPGVFKLDAGVLTVTAISSVPLPASAPMFGAALVGLGIVGYGLKRKTTAAAA